MSFPFSKNPFASSSAAMTSAVVSVSLVAVGTAIYLSPAGTHRGTPGSVRPPGTTSAATPTPPSTRTSTPATPAKSAARSSPPKTRPTATQVIRPPARTDVVVVKEKTTYLSTTPGPTRTQIVRVAATSTQTVVHVPSKAALIAPAHKYYGLAEDGLPGDTALFNRLDTTAGKAPDVVEWFEYWDDSFSTQKVTQAWQRGALPIITWQSVPHDFTNTALDLSSYSMKSIAAGTFDSYLTSFATAIATTALPVGIRLDQEMNGNWYPWAAGYQHRGIHNTPADFRAAWQHIWTVFQHTGANRYVIWAWTPSRTDTLTPGATTGYSAGDTGMAEDYPGDGYVDWLGLSAYQFRPTQPATYDFIFGGTLNGNSADIGLKSVSRKPIFIAEMGSAQTVGANTDNTANKAAWTKETLADIAADPRIVGFVLFNNNVSGVHSVKLTDGTHLTVDTDWRFDSSPPALAAFKAGIANPRYGSGLMPSQLEGTIKLDTSRT